MRRGDGGASSPLSVMTCRRGYERVDCAFLTASALSSCDQLVPYLGRTSLLRLLNDLGRQNKGLILRSPEHNRRAEQCAELLSVLL